MWADIFWRVSQNGAIYQPGPNHGENHGTYIPKLYPNTLTLLMAFVLVPCVSLHGSLLVNVRLEVFL